MSAWEIVLGVLVGLLVNECTDLSPWLARKVVRWAALRWSTDPDLGLQYAEEWTAIIEERPGKLLKLVTALMFAGGAVRRVVPRGSRRVQRRVFDDASLEGLGAASPAIAAVVVIAVGGAATLPVLVAGFVAVCVVLGYATMKQVARRVISMRLALGAGLGALAVTGAAFGAPDAGVADAWIGALLLIGAVFLLLAPSIDVARRADRLLDGPDYAAAAAVAGVLGTLVRIAAILVPGAALAVGALLVLLVVVTVRLMPPGWRRGPTLGVAASAGTLALFAGYAALGAGIRAFPEPGAIWVVDLSA